jgi:hypothetical protein
MNEFLWGLGAGMLTASLLAVAILKLAFSPVLLATKDWLAWMELQEQINIETAKMLAKPEEER